MSVTKIFFFYRPDVGICFGCQAISKALGGTIETQKDVGEIFTYSSEPLVFCQQEIDVEQTLPLQY
eukprot:Awhi_evm2s6504